MGEDVMEHNNGVKEKNKEKVAENSKQKLIKLRGTNRLMKMAKVASEGERKKLSKENASIGEGKVGRNELTSIGITRQETKKVASKKAALQGKDVPGTFHRIKSSRKPEMGMIFMCNSETKRDCYRYKVLGLPENRRELVGNVHKGMVLFLYDVDLKLMYGIYKAAGPGGYNIEPNAFNSQFPSQVRFKVLDHCKPLAEENFRKAIQKNYFTRSKFGCKLTSEQVQDLCKIFRAASRRSSGKDRIREHGVGYNKRRAAVEEPRYHRHPYGYERDGVAFREAQVRRFPATSHSYAHERTPETDTYRRRPSAKARDDSFRHDRVEEPWEAYEQDLLLDQHRYYRQEAVPESHTSYRRDGMMDRDDLHPFDFNPRWEDDDDDEIRNHRSYDHYSSYRECSSYRDPDYRMTPPERFSGEYSPASYRSPKYRSGSGPLPEYRNADLLPEYRVSPAMWRSRR
nr:AT-rich interactive domain-containing protein 4B-like [Ipomoea batatas]